MNDIYENATEAIEETFADLERLEPKQKCLPAPKKRRRLVITPERDTPFTTPKKKKAICRRRIYDESVNPLVLTEALEGYKLIS